MAEKILTPIHIGQVTLPNRIMKTGAGTSFIGENGRVGNRIIGFYETLAKGGVGLVTVESTGVEFPTGTHHPSVQLHLENDSYIPGYQQLTDAVHKHNRPVFIQLFHSGPWHPQSWTGIQPIAASALPKNQLPNPHLDEPREVSGEEIEILVEKFVDAAERAKKAGFDGVEVNASSTHLINSFLSPGWNRRQDEYGCQNLENRSRFLVEIITGIKGRLGRDYPVSVLLTGVEYGLDKGVTLEDSCGIAQIVEKAGADAIQVRGYGYRNYEFIHPGPEQLFYPEPIDPLPPELDWGKNGAGAFVPLSAAFKKVVSVPVIAVGRLDPEMGESILEKGEADIIGMNRRLLADPELPRKVAGGRLDEIAPCSACLYCWSRRRRNLPIRCRVNSRLGNERELIASPAEHPKKIVVVGGGPAGMEAARVAAIRGHQVTLLEKESRTGGLLSLAALVKGTTIEDLPLLIKYLQGQLVRYGVTVEKGKRATPQTILSHRPDAVIIATGGKPAVPDIPGIHSKKVLSMERLHRQLKVLLKVFDSYQLNRLTRIWMPVGKRALIIGSGIQACELAEFLVKRKRAVTIVDTQEVPGVDIVPDETKDSLLNWLVNKGTVFHMNSEITEIRPEGVKIVSNNGQETLVKADSIIPALPLVPNPELFKSLENRIEEVFAVGDCGTPGLIPDAVSTGAEVGYQI
ncbi:MAG: FAD-dependent oxidoreductase [Desulfofustis sp.]|jgi:2,4-dienoyl-CoA reductase (NADPH2)